MNFSEKAFLLILVALFILIPFIEPFLFLIFGDFSMFYPSIIAILLIYILFKKFNCFSGFKEQLKINWKIIISSLVIWYILNYTLNAISPKFPFFSSISMIQFLLLAFGAIGLIYFLLKSKGEKIKLNNIITLFLGTLIIPVAFLTVIILINTMLGIIGTIELVPYVSNFDIYSFLRLQPILTIIQMFFLISLFSSFKNIIPRDIILTIFLIGFLQFLFLQILTINSNGLSFYNYGYLYWFSVDSIISTVLSFLTSTLSLVSACFIAYLVRVLAERIKHAV